MLPNDSYNGPSAGSPSAGSESAYGDDEMEREQVCNWAVKQAALC